MDLLAPQGPVYQAGTLSGNPLAMNAGLSVLKRLNQETFDILEKVSSKIHKGFLRNIEETNTKAIINRVGSMMTLFFTDSDNVCNFEEALSCDTDKYSNYFKSMLDMGIYLPPSQYECCFFSTSLTNEDIDKKFNLDSKNKIDWLTFNDNEKSVVEDVLKLKIHPLVPNSIPIYGYIYDCKTGNLKEVFEATKAGTKLNSST